MTILALFSMKSVNILAYYFLSCFHQATITSPRILTSIATAHRLQQWCAESGSTVLTSLRFPPTRSELFGFGRPGLNLEGEDVA
jgi:hypothetical protein